MHLTYFLLFVSGAVVVTADATMPGSMRQFFYPRGHLAEARDKPSKSEIDEARASYEAGDFTKYLPTPVQEAECYIEQQVTVRKPGRCVKLGGRIPACQTDETLDFNYSECS